MFHRTLLVGRKLKKTQVGHESNNDWTGRRFYLICRWSSIVVLMLINVVIVSWSMWVLDTDQDFSAKGKGLFLHPTLPIGFAKFSSHPWQDNGLQNLLKKWCHGECLCLFIISCMLLMEANLSPVKESLRRFKSCAGDLRLRHIFIITRISPEYL